MGLLAGKEMPLHKVAGELRVQLSEGGVERSTAITRDVMRPEISNAWPVAPLIRSALSKTVRFWSPCCMVAVRGRS